MTSISNFSGTETQTIVAAVPGRRIRVRRLILSSTGTSVYTFTLKSEAQPISPMLRPTNHLDLAFHEGQEHFTTGAGEPLVGAASGASIAASLWIDYDLVPA